MLHPRRKPDGKSRPFSATKVHGIIPVRSASMYALLVQNVLDPAVNSIRHLPSAQFQGAAIAVDAVVVERDGKRIALDVPEARQPRNMDDDALVLLALAGLDIEVAQVSLDEIRREPMHTNCGIVWAYRMRAVPFALRIQILHMLAEDGPLRLFDLLRSIRSQHDVSGAVLSLACADAIELELAAGHLGPDTKVSIRRS